jgi:ribosomal protein S18 acetylase RimI-like enzyme
MRIRTEAEAGMVEIVVARSTEHLQQVRELSREYVAWLVEFDRSLGVYDPDVFRAYGYEGGEAHLPGEYGEPDGCLLLAIVESKPAGCIALRKLDDSACELRMLFVHPEFRGLGVGRALVVALLDEGRKLGYSSMRLDTSRHMVSAYDLYASLGFRELGHDDDRRDSLKAIAISMERPLI